MQDLPNNCIIELISPQNIIFMKFDGNLEDEEYKQFWTKGINLAIEKKATKFIFEQTTLGKVSFSARGWVILKLIPRFKKGLSENMIAGVITSKEAINESGIRYLVKMFESLTNYEIEFYPNKDTAIEELGKKE